MAKDEILDLIQADIDTTQKSLLIWHAQQKLPLEEPYDEIVFELVKRLETTLALLLHARDTATDA